MECWVHQDTILDDDKAHQCVKEAWEHEDDKDELKIELQGLERQFCEWVQAVYVSNGRINVLWSE